MEQQYTCPFCFKDYTRFTIHEHYGCGVEPLETTEEIEQELDAISEEVAEQESVNVEEGLQAAGNELLEAVKAVNESYKEEVIPLKPEPKKRGRKPKAK